MIETPEIQSLINNAPILAVILWDYLATRRQLSRLERQVADNAETLARMLANNPALVMPHVIIPPPPIPFTSPN